MSYSTLYISLRYSDIGLCKEDPEQIINQSKTRVHADSFSGQNLRQTG